MNTTRYSEVTSEDSIPRKNILDGVLLINAEITFQGTTLELTENNMGLLFSMTIRITLVVVASSVTSVFTNK
jgi:hypothetical protein